MKWGCPSKMLWPSDFEMNGDRVRRHARYVGHTLKRLAIEGVTDRVVWRCLHCREVFNSEAVETEELPTEVVEMAALLWAMCASTPAVSSEAEDVLHCGAPQWGPEAMGHVVAVASLAADAWTVVMRRLGGKKIDRSIRLAEAEALIRTGEVTP